MKCQNENTKSGLQITRSIDPSIEPVDQSGDAIVVTGSTEVLELTTRDIDILFGVRTTCQEESSNNEQTVKFVQEKI